MKFVKLRIVVWNCCWMLMLFGGSTFAGVFPVHLSCESKLNPLGLSETSPRLGWQVVDFKPEIRGQYQSACPIQAITIFSVGADPRSLTLME